MIIRELLASKHAKLVGLLLGLNADDRYRRFGHSMTDEAIREYVDRIDWSEWVLLGAFDAHADLVGVLELADAQPGSSEIAIAVSAHHRGTGVGTALMERALLKARVRGKDRVTLICQADNNPMRRLAKAAGLQAVTSHGETEGLLDPEAARPEELAEDHTREAVDNVAYIGLLSDRAWVTPVETALKLPGRLIPAA